MTSQGSAALARPFIRSALVALVCLALLAVSMAGHGAARADSSGSSRVGPINGGFEEPVVDGQTPGWDQRGGAAGGSSVVTDPVHSGQHSLRLDDPESDRSYGLMSDRMPVRAGHSYQLSLQALIERGAPTLYVYFYDADGRQLDVEYANYTDEPAGEWTQLRLDASAPEQAATASIYLYSNIARISTFYVDEVNLTHTHAPLEVTDLGTAFHSPNVRLAETDVLSDGTPVGYVFSDGEPVSFNVVDLRTGELLDSHDMDAYSIAASVVVDDDDSVYLSVRGPNDGSLWRYDPASAEMERLASRIAGERMLRSLVIAEGMLFGTTYPNAKVFSYDLATGAIHDYGSVVDDGSYAWGFGMIQGNLWVGTGTNPHLMVLDPDTAALAEIPLPEEVTQAADFITRVQQLGDLVLVSFSPGGAENTAIYDLATEQWIGGIGGTVGPWTATSSDGLSYYVGDGTVRAFDPDSRQSLDIGWAESGIAEELDGTSAMSLVELGTEAFPGESLIGYRADGTIWRYNLAHGAGDVIDSGIVGAPATVHSVGTGGDGDIYFGAYLSAGVMARLDPATGQLEQLAGPKQADSITAHHNRTIVGTYPGADFHVALGNQEWEWGLNPEHVLGLGRDQYGQDRPVSLVSTGSRVAAATIPNYGELGGALTLFEPNSGTYEVHRNIVEDQSITELAYRDGLVYGGTSIHGGLSSEPTQDEAELFVWDARRDRLVSSSVVVPGAQVIHALAFDDDGDLWGFADNGVFFEYDVERGEVARTVSTPARVSSNWGRLSELYLHPDGRFYGDSGGRLFRFDPETDEFVTLMTDGAFHSTIDTAGNIYFADETNIYRYVP